MKNTKEAIRILIADDHPMFRDGLRAMLQSVDDFAIVGEASNGSEAIQLARETDPDIILLDVSMPVLSGFEVLRELTAFPETVRAILLTAGITRPEIVFALQLGARGVVWKESSAEVLFKSIRCVMQEQVWVSRECVRDLVDTLKTLGPDRAAGDPIVLPKAAFAEKTLISAKTEGVDQQRTSNVSSSPTKFGLTARELEIVSAIIDGQSNRDIAVTYGISEYTVKHHLTRIFDKVGVFSRLELAMFAIHHGVPSPIRETTAGS